MSMTSMPHGNRNLINNRISMHDRLVHRIDFSEEDYSLLGGGDRRSVTPEAKLDAPVRDIEYDDIRGEDDPRTDRNILGEQIAQSSVPVEPLPDDEDHIRHGQRVQLVAIEEGHIDSDFPNHTFELGMKTSTDVTEVKGNIRKEYFRNPVSTNSGSLLDPSPEKDLVRMVPSAIMDYYNEAAMRAKQRKALDNDQFGLPRLRAYPLNDPAHVRAAIRMFGHCKDPEDRRTLANNIFAAMRKFHIDTKIGSGNGLYEYAPRDLRESGGLSGITVAGFEKPMAERTKKDIIREHLRINGPFYNNVFYGGGPTHDPGVVEIYNFLDYFYPNLTTMEFPVRLKCVCGGIATSDELYRKLGIRRPLEIEHGKGKLGWLDLTSNAGLEKVREAIRSAGYRADRNWFKVDLSDNDEHTIFCLRLYSIMGGILLNPNFGHDSDSVLDDKHIGILLDWSQLVEYHYALYEDASAEAERLRECQYLFDLFWNYNDNPRDPAVRQVNAMSLLRHTAQGICSSTDDLNETNDDGDLMSKEKCNGYLIKELGVDDDLYLLPKDHEHPVVDRASVQFAMDQIQRIPERRRKEYARNLNRKYHEFSCRFQITRDHPYAKYAEKDMVNREHVLFEIDTVEDQGTSSNDSESTDRAHQPWYKRLDMSNRVGDNALGSRELGPNTKKIPEPPYTPHDALI